jgi:uncharacterized protein YdeI (YjbR/CyaY-like superfamily)
VQIGRTFYAPNRKVWRSWLAKHHRTRREVFLIYYKKGSGRPRIPYSDAVEEALCYGWIDSTVKAVDARRYAQRFSPRRPGSKLSETNKERIRRLLKARKMTRWGLSRIEHVFTEHRTNVREKFIIPPDILAVLKSDPVVWKHFGSFPESYRRIRIGYLVGSQSRPAEYRKRLRYFLGMTARNRMFGTVR